MRTAGDHFNVMALGAFLHSHMSDELKRGTAKEAMKPPVSKPEDGVA